MLNMLSEVDILPGIGEKTKADLNRAGIFTVRDLFYYLPRDYENYQNLTHISDLHPGKVSFIGKIVDIETKNARSRRLSITEAIVSDGDDSVRAVWFNQPYRATQFKDKNIEYLFSGQYELQRGRYQLSNPKVEKATAVEEASAYAGKFQPIYPQKSAIKPDTFKRLIFHLRAEFAKIPDLLPSLPDSSSFAGKNARRDALYKIHFPENQSEADVARTYLSYEELFELILAARLNRNENKKLTARQIPYNNDAMQQLLKSLPFQLTQAQKISAWEIIKDLEKKTPMNRLLQGDVGSGKTIVAATAILQATKAGFQSALLAPTSILATQHAEELDKILSPLGVKIGLLVGATKHKPELKSRIKSGEVDLVVGTHAIITDDTQFQDLSLCIIDEQHRFGVQQRQKLLLKAQDFAPHLLSMTATPIPRSLQLTVFGDLDVSIISEMPHGRKPIRTKVLTEVEQRETLYPHIRDELNLGRQAYWICKKIEDGHSRDSMAKQETISVKRQTEKLKTIFPRAKIEFLHGRMKPAEKDEIMAKFSNHKIDILVSTTVVEVGVNVPNATIMVIMDAESYGLAQLHQLRGRVGRGDFQSYCYLITSAEQPTRRLLEVEKSTDGFHLAEVDLKLRGPGEIYGSLQHGALDLRIASLADTHLINLAQRHAEKISQNPEIMIKYKELGQGIKKYQQLTTLN
ncbi:MAG: ATP-dependent DNA helicase RecG [Candidatus Saccharibacteria bacterium]|nr:ATP-dependent DNA helicase RecG [Candidatus Saccharibacteria bacterium]